jgi:hypothetical protein
MALEWKKTKSTQFYKHAWVAYDEYWVEWYIEKRDVGEYELYTGGDYISTFPSPAVCKKVVNYIIKHRVDYFGVSGKSELDDAKGEWRE